VGITRHRLELFGHKAVVEEGNAEQLPYPDNTFDHLNCQGVIHHTTDTLQCLREFHRVIKPGGTLSFSVYYKLLIYRWPLLFKVVVKAFQPWIVLHGRGREGMLYADTPKELVRLYDGSENPIGKAFSVQEIQKMLAGRFQVLGQQRYLIPRRALPVSIPNHVHYWLSRIFGLMIVFRCKRIDTM